MSKPKKEKQIEHRGPARVMVQVPEVSPVDRVKQLFRGYFADYERHAEHSGHGSGPLPVTTDTLVDALLEALGMPVVSFPDEVCGVGNSAPADLLDAPAIEE